MGRKNQNKLTLGDFNAICDVCRWKFKSTDLRERWDGLMVCEKDWEPRHPQDFIRAIPDMQALPWTRPDPTPTGEGGGNASSSLPSGFNTLTGEENPSSTQVGPDRAPYFNTFGSYAVPVPTLTITPTSDSMTIGYSISCTNSENVFAGRVYSNGDVLLLHSGGGSASGTLDLSGVTFAEGATIDIVYEIEDIEGQFYTATQTVDPYFGYVKLLVHADADYTDSSLLAATLTQTGSAQSIDTTTKFYGAGSIASVQVGSTIDSEISTPTNTAYAPGTEFTLEFAIKLTSQKAGAYHVYFTSDTTNGGVEDNPTTNRLQFIGVFLTTPLIADVTLDTWYQIAITRDASNVVRAFQDGVLKSSTTDSSTFGSSNAFISIGGQSGSYSTDGFLDEIRFTNGVCRYTADYTVASAAFPDQ